MRLHRRLWVSAALIAASMGACGPRAPEHEVVTPEGSALRLPLADIDDGRVHFYTFEHSGKNVNFLVRSDGNGQLHVHLDACYSCYRYRRGFVEEEASLLCIACRYSYPLENEIWEFQGACAPIPIHFALEEDFLVVERRLLEKASKYF